MARKPSKSQAKRAPISATYFKLVEDVVPRQHNRVIGHYLELRQDRDQESGREQRPSDDRDGLVGSEKLVFSHGVP